MFKDRVWNDKGGLTPFGVGTHFALAGAAVGVAAGFRQGEWGGAATGGFAGCVVGALMGLALGFSPRSNSPTIKGRVFDKEGGWTPFGVGTRFALVGAAGAAAIGFQQEGWEGAALGGFVGLVVGSLTGLGAGFVTRLARWAVARLLGARHYDGLVRRPDYWGRALICERCGWHTRPDDPIRVRDCFSRPPLFCPRCESPVARPVIECPACGAFCPPRVRFPISFRAWLWRGDVCDACGCEFDLWGRELRPRATRGG